MGQVSKQLVPLSQLARLAETRQTTKDGRRPAMFIIAGYMQQHPGEDILDQTVAEATGLPLASVQKVLSKWTARRADITREGVRTYRYTPKRKNVTAQVVEAAPPRQHWAYRTTDLRTASGEDIVADRNGVAHVIRPVL